MALTKALTLLFCLVMGSALCRLGIEIVERRIYFDKQLCTLGTSGFKH